MDFIDKLRQFSKRVESMRNSISTEEATKTSLIMPFFSMLGYDVFNPEEFLPEFTADVGIKKGEKVDYAILKDGQPVILIECKWIGENLEKHDSQLFRYFGTSSAKFGILTNGQIYRFYTDLEEPNKMDDTPFLEFNMLEIKESLVPELKKFHKDVFSTSEVFDTASDLKYTNQIKEVFASELSSPNDDFVRFFLQNVYSGVKTQTVVERFKPIVKKALSQYINEMMNEKIKTALDSSVEVDATAVQAPQEEYLEKPVVQENKIVTTNDELEAYFIIKNLLRDVVPMDEITFKDNETYMAILLKNNTRKWICRLAFTNTQKSLVIPDEDKKPVSYTIADIYEIENYKELLEASLRKYI